MRRRHPHVRLLLVPPVIELAGGVMLFTRASGSARDVAVIIGVVMIVDGVAELLLAIDAKRHDGRGAVPLVASS
jgi:uncharacterized membrane protein HdeD (DUF308 family)